MNWSAKWAVFWKDMSEPYWQDLLVDGLLNTIKVAILGFIIGIIIGTIIAMIKVAPKYKKILRVLDKVCDCYIALFRGTPMVVQLLVTYYVLIPAIGIKGVEAINVGIIVFGMNSGAYIAEIMRGGINSVDAGQMEAGRSVGLGYGTTMLKIVIPQAIKNILPTLGNEFITLIKETSVLSFITVYDLYTALYALGASNYEKVMPFLFMALIYIVLVLFITLIIKLLEKFFARSERNRKQIAKKKKTA